MCVSFKKIRRFLVSNICIYVCMYVNLHESLELDK